VAYALAEFAFFLGFFATKDAGAVLGNEGL
jgi:hypothetical protein